MAESKSSYMPSEVSRPRVPRALTVAGSDSGGGAGIQADLKTFSALEVYGMSAITALTAQNTTGVHGIYSVDPSFVAQQIRACVSDIGVDAVKTGMLANAEIVRTVARELSDAKVPNIVVDPVMISKSGHALLSQDAWQALSEYLIPMATVVTPNLHEASALTGLEIADEKGMREAAVRIFGMGVKVVVVKGGHLGGGDELSDTEGSIKSRDRARENSVSPVNKEATDIVFDGKDFFRLVSPRFATRSTHGTGCTFSSAIAAYLAKGFPVLDAIKEAKLLITWAIENAFPLGKGYGPTNHFFFRRKEPLRI